MQFDFTAFYTKHQHELDKGITAPRLKEMYTELKRNCSKDAAVTFATSVCLPYLSPVKLMARVRAAKMQNWKPLTSLNDYAHASGPFEISKEVSTFLKDIMWDLPAEARGYINRSVTPESLKTPVAPVTPTEPAFTIPRILQAN